MKELLLELIVFNHLSNCCHNFTTPGKYQILNKMYFGGVIEPQHILFECPIEVFEKYQELEHIIQKCYPELRPAELSCEEPQETLGMELT
jgi:hypothetical protein